MSVCVSHFKTPTICLHHLAWTSADYFSSATLPARGEACRAGSCRKPKMKNIENLKEQLPVHDDQALLQRGHHVPGQVPPLLLTHRGHAPVDAVRKKQPAISKKILTKNLSEKFMPSESAMMLGNMRSISRPAAAGESEPCTAFFMSSVGSPNTDRILLGADFFASDTLVGPIRVLQCLMPFSRPKHIAMQSPLVMN